MMGLIYRWELGYGGSWIGEEERAF
jgi:hypothetical protein